MVDLRREEEWARLLISRTLGVPVVQHDDGSQDGMHDLDLLEDGEPFGAVEITAAADGNLIALWNLMNRGDGRWIVPTIRGGWLVSLDSWARGKRVLNELPDLLKKLEQSAIEALEPLSRQSQHRDFLEAARDLGVASARQSGTEFPGSVYVTIDLPLEQGAGWVSDSADPLVEWANTFLCAPDRSDVLTKLRRSGAPERHAFIVCPGFSTAPFVVTDLLMRNDVRLPSAKPVLPNEVTHVWLAGTWSAGRGIRSSPEEGWSFFEK